MFIATIASSSYKKVRAPSTAIFKEKRIFEQCGTLLSHESVNHYNALKSALVDLKVVAESLEDLCLDQVPAIHKFELVEDTPIYFRPRRLSPVLNNIVE